MRPPFLPPRVKQCHQGPGHGIQRGNVWAFAQIAMEAREREILQPVIPAVLPRDDVLNVQDKKRICTLRNTAVFTAMRGSLPD